MDTFFDNESIKSVVSDWLDKKKPINLKHDTNADTNVEIRTETRPNRLGLGAVSDDRSLSTAGALVKLRQQLEREGANEQEIVQALQQHVSQKKKKYAELQKQLDEELEEGRSAVISKKTTKKPKLKAILEKKNAQSNKQTNQQKVANPIDMHFQQIEQTKDNDKDNEKEKESEQNDETVSHLPSVQNDFQKKPQSFNSHSALQWTKKTITEMIENQQNNSLGIPLSTLGKKFRETFQRHFPSVAKTSLKKFLENAQNSTNDSPLFSLCVDGNNSEHHEIYVRFWKEGDIIVNKQNQQIIQTSQTSQTNQINQINQRRKTKTRSKQKNIRKDKREQSQIPQNYSYPGAKRKRENDQTQNQNPQKQNKFHQNLKLKRSQSQADTQNALQTNIQYPKPYPRRPLKKFTNNFKQNDSIQIVTESNSINVTVSEPIPHTDSSIVENGVVRGRIITKSPPPKLGETLNYIDNNKDTDYFPITFDRTGKKDSLKFSNLTFV